MNRLATTVTLIVTLGAIATGCADPEGLSASGIVSLTVRQPGQPDGTTGFNLPTDSAIDAPPGVGRGVFGTCTRSINRWTVDLSAANPAAATGLRRVVIGATEGGITSPTTGTFTLGNVDFTGTGACTALASPYGDKGVRITGNCTSLGNAGDQRTVNVVLNLTLERCNVQ